MPSDKVPLLEPYGELINPADQQTVVDQAARKLYEESLPAVIQIKTNRGSGTGFFINAEGRIVTAAHVVQDSAEQFAVTPDGTRYKLMLEKLDDINDIAVMKPIGMPAGQAFFELAKDSKLKPEQSLYAIGHPEGRRPAYLSPGNFKMQYSPIQLVNEILPDAIPKLSKKISNWTPKERNDVIDSLDRPLLHSILQIRHGNSGGPLVDENRKIVGISDMINPDVPTRSYFVPVEKIHDLLNAKDDKFSFTYTRTPEEWARGYMSDWRNAPSLAVFETGAAGIAGYAAYRLTRAVPRGAAVAFAGLGTAALTMDAGDLLASTDSRDKTKFALAALADVATVGGAMATLVPKARPFGMAAIGLGVVGRAATDFIPTRLVLTDVSRKNGENRSPFEPPI